MQGRLPIVTPKRLLLLASFGFGRVVLLLPLVVLLADAQVAAVDGALQLGKLLLVGVVLGVVGQVGVECVDGILQLPTALGGR